MENSSKSLKRSSSHTSMSDTDSATSQQEFHSLPSESPVRSDDRAIVVVDTPSPPGNPNLPTSSQAVREKGFKPWPHSERPTPENLDFPATQGNRGSENLEFQAKNGLGGARNPPVPVINLNVRDEPKPGVMKVEKVRVDIGGVEEGYGGGGGGGGGGEDEVGGEREAVEAILKRSKAELKVRKVALFFRVFEVIACLISFTVMAADKTQGWSGDSFDRYKEYRYCLLVNVAGFVYSGFQAVDLAYHLVTGNHVITDYLRYHFDFSMDQILAYLLMSASSSAATRVDDWIMNWGQDEFTLFASASVAMSFVAFLAFAISSVISGYNLCNRGSI
ncbi:CASP 4A3 [Olea europaea subsp. europaea]|uniref:CASP-like protein n=1 Tax=Olea europaea subsp. europaea TaxID=158383 RepID=A0A8S0S7G6_OLEEU|nr:CASP 4A3 [Olea europaea subsp. europaea]